MLFATFSTPKCQIANPLSRLFRRPNGLIHRPSHRGRDLSALFTDYRCNKGPNERGTRCVGSFMRSGLLSKGCLLSIPAWRSVLRADGRDGQAPSLSLSLSPSSVILMDVSYPFLPRPEAPISLPPAAAAVRGSGSGGRHSCLLGRMDR